MWCPKCGIEYREGITVCADCGTELVERPEGETVDICEMNDEKTADEIVEYLTYSGIEEVVKEREEGGSFRIVVPVVLEKQAERLFRGYLLAKEEEKDKKAEETDHTVETEQIDAAFMEENEEENVALTDEIKEDTVDLLYASNKKEYTKYADKYRDTQLSGVTFLIFGLIGGIYLILSKTGAIPIQYHAVVFWIIAVLFAGLAISGIMSIVKASKMKELIPREEEKTKAIKQWLDQNLTKEMVEGWSDNNVSEGENDLVVTAHIRAMLIKEYKGEPIEYLEMITDEYFEEHYLGTAEK